MGRHEKNPPVGKDAFSKESEGKQRGTYFCSFLDFNSVFWLGCAKLIRMTTHRFLQRTGKISGLRVDAKPRAPTALMTVSDTINSTYATTGVSWFLALPSFCAALVGYM
jgi:hypothetical protein